MLMKRPDNSLVVNIDGEHLTFCDVHNGYVRNGYITSDDCPYCSNKDLMEKHAFWYKYPTDG